MMLNTSSRHIDYKTSYAYSRGLVCDVKQAQVAWLHPSDSDCPIPGLVNLNVSMALERHGRDTTGENMIRVVYGVVTPGLYKANGAKHAEGYSEAEYKLMDQQVGVHSIAEVLSGMPEVYLEG